MKTLFKKIINKIKTNIINQPNEQKSVMFLWYDNLLEYLTKEERDYLVMSYITVYDMEYIDANISTIYSIITNIFLNHETNMKIIEAKDIIEKLKEIKLKELFEFIINQCYYNEFCPNIPEIYRYIKENNMSETILNNIDYMKFYNLDNINKIDIENAINYYTSLYLVYKKYI